MEILRKSDTGNGTIVSETEIAITCYGTCPCPDFNPCPDNLTDPICR